MSLVHLQMCHNWTTRGQAMAARKPRGSREILLLSAFLDASGGGHACSATLMGRPRLAGKLESQRAGFEQANLNGRVDQALYMALCLATQDLLMEQRPQ